LYGWYDVEWREYGGRVVPYLCDGVGGSLRTAHSCGVAPISGYSLDGDVSESV